MDKNWQSSSQWLAWPFTAFAQCPRTSVSTEKGWYVGKILHFAGYEFNKENLQYSFTEGSMYDFCIYYRILYIIRSTSFNREKEFYEEKMIDEFPDFLISLHRLAMEMGWEYWRCWGIACRHLYTAFLFVFVVLIMYFFWRQIFNIFHFSVFCCLNFFALNVEYWCF